MLSEEVIEKLVERLVDRIEETNIYLLKEIGKSVKKIGTLTSTDAHRLGQILKYGGDYQKIVNKIVEITNLNMQDIDKIFNEVAKKDYDFAKKFYDYRDIKFIPYEENIALKQQVAAIANITKNTYFNLSNTRMLGIGVVDKQGKAKFKVLKQAYYDIIDTAILNVGQGKESFDSVMFKQLKELGAGLKVISPTKYQKKVITSTGEVKYVETNRTIRLDSAIRQQMKDGLRMLHNETQKEIGKEFESDGVEISVHLNPADDHQLVQGKQFSNEEFEKFQNDMDAVSYDGTLFLAEFEGHDRRSISQYNCYHYIFSIVLGVSEPEYSDKQLKEIIEKNKKGFTFEGTHYTNYEGTQLQRQLETAIRRQKDNQILGVASDNKLLIEKSQKNITRLTAKYNELCKVSGLPRKADRLRVAGYKRKSTK